ncbi:lysine--tRNA ligase [Candidatus Woesebacteria bacterium]|nr:lysine--tRNA ligase [Candidatus Woesebacteria bacterium]
MYWADRIAEEIISSGKYKPYWVDDMKTPSGRVHIGSVRAVITHDLIYKALRDQGVKATFSYVLEDHDPMDGLPIYLDQEEYKKHLGKPLYMIPSPEPGYKSYGERWGKEYIEIFNKVGCKPKIIWGSELYLTGKMNEAIELCLDSADKIRKIYKKLYKKILPDNWYPFNIICEKCGKISTTIVSAWDGEEVTYECKIDAVDWTQGCGQKGKISPFDGNGKLPWKVEWPCKWKVIGVTIEGAGKDHMSAGGSHDFAKLNSKSKVH